MKPIENPNSKSSKGQMPKLLTKVLILLLLLLTLAACGEPTNTPVPVPTATIAATTTPTAKTTTATTAKTTATVATKTEPDLTAVLPEKAVVRTFTDLEGRTIRLLYGRGAGHGGDYGWAHILGKHVNGIWYDGGTITTFPKAVGAKTPAEVISLIDKSLEDKTPDSQSGGRRSYVYFVPGTKNDVFTVVGSDGTIITSYPVPHGSKDLDS
jgi:hypothetical protein